MIYYSIIHHKLYVDGNRSMILNFILYRKMENEKLSDLLPEAEQSWLKIDLIFPIKYVRNRQSKICPDNIPFIVTRIFQFQFSVCWGLTKFDIKQVFWFLSC